MVNIWSLVIIPLIGIIVIFIFSSSPILSLSFINIIRLVYRKLKIYIRFIGYFCLSCFCYVLVNFPLFDRYTRKEVDKLLDINLSLEDDEDIRKVKVYRSELDSMPLRLDYIGNQTSINQISLNKVSILLLKQVALFFTLLNFIISLLLWNITFDSMDIINFKTFNYIENIQNMVEDTLHNTDINIPFEESYHHLIQIQIPNISSVFNDFLWNDENVSNLSTNILDGVNEINLPDLTAGYQFVLGLDGISIYFILLTTFIMPITILSSWSADFFKPKNASNFNTYSNTPVVTFLVIILLLESLLILAFSCLDILLFYIFFESILPPLFLLIGLYGSSNKVRASYYLFLYTLFGSLFLLLAILTMSFLAGSTDFTVLFQTKFDVELQKILWLAIFFAFAIKTPIFPVHLWLYLAHAEAPISGSQILAAIVLKLAVYGILRILIPILPEATAYFTPLVYTMSIITIIYASLTTLRQCDFKVIVAYSSVAHMSSILIGLFSNTIVGIEGAILLSLAHGFTSSALFYLVGEVLYSRTHTRIINYYKGLTISMPLFSIFFLIFNLFNCAVPLSGNFIGELLCLAGGFHYSPLLTLIAMVGIILSAAYSVWLYNRICSGTYSAYLPLLPDLYKREAMVLVPLLIGAIAIGVYPNFVLDLCHYPVSSLIYHIS